MGNITKLERARSHVTPRRTSRKVESASMSDKCEIQFQGASGGPEQQYDAYIHWFYYFHRGPAPLASLADAASTCLEKENSMTLLWRTVKAFSYIQGSIVGECIVEWMRTVIKEKGEIEHPFGIDAAKEAELISEWLRHGRRMLTDDEYTLCHEIRAVACKLFVIRGEWTVDIASALLGIRKEAEWLIENLKRFPVESISTSMKIRQFALDFVWEKIGEYASYKNKESSESEMASESDADVTESNDNDYMVCYDEDYLKLGTRSRPLHPHTRQYLHDQSKSKVKTELTRYLEDIPQENDFPDDDFDILQWWRVNSCKYPILSRMALDLLAVPASSVASESAFSTGSRIISDYRSRLASGTVEALVCLQDWMRADGFGDPYSILTDTAEGDDDIKSFDISGKLPCEFYAIWVLRNFASSGAVQYNAYLHWFYYFHTSLAPLASLVDAASMEAELISEWLRHGRCILNDEEYAFWYGIRKEAEWLIENLKRNNVESISTSMKIRQFALDFLCEKYVEYGSFKKQESSESEMASESDEDVVEEHTYYVGDLHDEDYLKLRKKKTT
uniref:HAT C-terminal dimerisation domain-containing protein n=1 Tax=Oryza sativa subsp. japonica TaxID=39947 RepID=Q6K7P5_ORYSJ|nr:hypothetical protein [Oryza sativa Japonica Group]